jgi:hypothetical protein
MVGNLLNYDTGILSAKHFPYFRRGKTPSSSTLETKYLGRTLRGAYFTHTIAATRHIPALMRVHFADNESLGG